jgi:hypothetical protein
MITPDQLRKAVSGFSLVQDIDSLPRGYLRVETQLKYPDGTSIEVFLKDRAPPAVGFLLSDLGQTTGWLMTAQVKPWMSKKRQGLLNEILRSSGVIQQGGALELNADDIATIPTTILKLAQTCSRVADLTFTKRTALQTLAKEEVEEIIVDLELPYEQDFEIACINRTVKVDFLVRAAFKTSAILALSSMSSNSAHTTANEIFTKWYDIKATGRTEERVTIFDDRYDVYRDEDINRLSDLSAVVPMSDRKSLQEIVAH